jgi:DNA polymerase-3 subunit beta
MNTSCLQENLSKGLAVVGRAVATNPTLPVLSHVLVKTVNGTSQQIHLAATDLELSIACQVGAKVQEEGAFALPARLLTDLVNALPSERIDLSDSESPRRVNGSLHLACGRNEADVKGVDAQEFPALSAIDGEHTLEIDPIVLRHMIAQVAFAASGDEVRPVLTGVQIRLDGHTLTMAAADGFRLSVCAAQLPAEIGEPVSIIVPARALRELLRLGKDETAPVGIHITPARSQILFHLHGQPGAPVTDVNLISQLIEGKYPDVTKIVPQSHQTRAVLAREAFLKACKTALIFARTEGNVVHLTIDPETGQVKATASSIKMGETEIDLDATIEGEPVEIAFNVRFLVDALSAMDEGQVALETTSASHPGVLRPVGGKGFVHVIMPLSVRGS